MKLPNNIKINLTPKIIWISVTVGVVTLLLGGFIALCIDVATYTTFYDKYYKIEMKYPKEWKKLEEFQGTIVAFVAPARDALETMPANVNVTVTDNLDDGMSMKEFVKLATLQTETLFGTTIEVLESKPMTLSDGHPAHSYMIKSKAAPIVQTRFILYLNGNKGFIITCMADEMNFQKAKGMFNAMIKSYRINVNP